MYEPHGRGSKSLDRPYLVRRSHSTPCSESDNNLEHGSGSSGSNVPVRSQSNKRVIPPYARGGSPPNTPNKLGGSQGKLNQNNKLIGLKIVLLDESVTQIQAQSKALGRVVFDQVCKQLNVLEADYFGLEYSSPGNSSTSASSTAASSPPPLSASNSILNSSILSSSTSRSSTAYWLDLEKRLTRQVAFNMAEPVLRFSVKFYTPDPSQLEEEFTRYLFSLQIKRDLQAGILVCNDNTAALMASYIVQAECGDFSEEDYPDASYLSMYKFIPHQDYEIERKIRENHKKHIGQSPAEADLHLLETARRTELYGIRMHPARDEDGISLNLSVCHNGLLVFQNFTKINTFSWAKIRKLSFKRKRFILKLHPEVNISDGYYKDLVEFIFDSRNECKAYWKRCVEHHAFFRCEKAPNPIHRSKGLLSSRGSSFRYSGRTQKQMVQFVRENFVKRPTPMGGPQTGGMPTPGNVLVPDVSSSDNNSFDNSIVSGDRIENRGGVVGGSGRFQRSSSLRSGTAGQQVGTPAASTSATPSTDYNTPVTQAQQHISKSMSTIASKNYEEDTVIYTSRAEANARARDPDWFFYLCKELSHVLITYLKDLRVLKTLLSNQDTGLSSLLPHSLISQTDHLVSQITSLMREKEIWEEGRHGLEIINLCGKYFQNQEDVYLGYCKNLEEILKRITEDYSCYLPVEGVSTRPIVFCQYYIESFCRECGCCGGNIGGGALKKVNFSPMLEKKKPTSLDGNLVLKLHNTHVLLNRILEPYYKSSLRLLTVIKVQELTREMEGFSGIARVNDKVGLVDLTGEFVRQGILLKLNKRKGLQNRIFFLFRDMLVYGTRVSSTQGFRLHGIILTRNMELLDSNVTGISSIPWSFSIVVRSNELSEEVEKPNEKILVLAAFTERDHGFWVQSISNAIDLSVNAQAHGHVIASKLFNSSEELLNNNLKLSTEHIGSSNTQVNAHHNRANALSHVCWHRNISICGNEIVDKERHQISGPLLRKFKNSPGWQRLWVVFTTVCLYFYKNANETVPLASLPLLGYKIELLNETEKTQILKEHVFKLVFKNHVYYFRAESRYTFGRWVYTLSNACLDQHT